MQGNSRPAFPAYDIIAQQQKVDQRNQEEEKERVERGIQALEEKRLKETAKLERKRQKEAKEKQNAEKRMAREKLLEENKVKRQRQRDKNGCKLCGLRYKGNAKLDWKGCEKCDFFWVCSTCTKDRRVKGTQKLRMHEIQCRN